MNPLIEKAAQYAAFVHGDQYRDDGKTPFIEHPRQVVKILMQVTTDENLIAAAWLHDTIEDTPTTYADLLEHFGHDIACLVNEVTHEGKPDSRGFYFPRLKTQRGIMLKFADRLSNISDMADWDDSRRAHYLRKSKFWKSE